MLADVDIANMALGHLGISVTIQSLTPPDQTQQAQTLSFWYPKCRDQLLQDAPWNFADTFVNLVQEPVPSANGPLLGYAAPGWPFSYQYPQDCLQPLAVTTLAGARYGQMFWQNYWWPTPALTFCLPKIPFKLMESQANPGALAIFCDIQATAGSPLYLYYIQQVTNTAIFDPMFCDALSWLIAWKAGQALRVDKERISEAQAGYTDARNKALAQHLNASQQDIERDSPSITVRW